LDSEDYAKLHLTGPTALPMANLKTNPTARQVVAPKGPVVLVVLYARELPGMFPTARFMTLSRGDVGEDILQTIQRQLF
jgi:hypothetical protein